MVSSSVSTTEYMSFDILGRLTLSKQTTDGVEYHRRWGHRRWGQACFIAFLTRKLGETFEFLIREERTPKAE